MEELVVTLLEYAREDIERGHKPATFDLVAYEAELRSMSEVELLVKKHPCCPSHCCAYHGCKYGDYECPIAAKKMPQQVLCESCAMDDEIYSVEEAMALSNGAAKKEFLRELSHRAAKYNDPAVDAFVASLYAESCVDPTRINCENEEVDEEVDEDGQFCGRHWG
jgi:hypothetical protein